MNDSELLQHIAPHKEKLLLLLKSKVFETKGGKATLHFDDKGQLRQININKITFKN